MAKTSSAKKALRASKKRHVFNARRKVAMKFAVKTMGKLILAKSADTSKSFSEMQQAIDKAASRGTIKKNTAARMKSRLAKRVAAMAK